MALPGCSWVLLAALGCSWFPWLLLAAPGCSQLPLAAPGWPLVASGCSWSALAAPWPPCLLGCSLAAPWLIPDCFLVFLNAPCLLLAGMSPVRQMKRTCASQRGIEASISVHTNIMKQRSRSVPEAPCPVCSVSPSHLAKEHGKGPLRHWTGTATNRFGRGPLRERIDSAKMPRRTRTATASSKNRLGRVPLRHGAATAKDRFGKGPHNCHFDTGPRRQRAASAEGCFGMGRSQPIKSATLLGEKSCCEGVR